MRPLQRLIDLVHQPHKEVNFRASLTGETIYFRKTVHYTTTVADLLGRCRFDGVTPRRIAIDTLNSVHVHPRDRVYPLIRYPLDQTNEIRLVVVSPVQ